MHAFADGLLERIRDGRVDEAVVDRALERVLRQKVELGLLDPDWSPVPAALAGGPDDAEALQGTIDLDPAENRALAARIAERATVLLTNDGTLPLAAPARIAVVGPNADRWTGLLGCYSFPAHVGGQHPDVPLGIALPTPLDAIRAEFPAAQVTAVEGTGIDDFAIDGIAAAAQAAREADVAVVVLGDRAGLFGRGHQRRGLRRRVARAARRAAAPARRGPRDRHPDRRRAAHRQAVRPRRRAPREPPRSCRRSSPGRRGRRRSPAC